MNNQETLFGEAAPEEPAPPEFQLHPPWFLLPDFKDPAAELYSPADWIDVGLLFWNLEKKMEEHPERWGWDRHRINGKEWVLGKNCYCGEKAVMWQKDTGYRCGAHVELPVADSLPTERPMIGYAGDMDLSGDYEHPW